MSRLLPLVAILGPTATGKSALAVQLAARLGAEILACDSTQVYRGFDIGTAKLRPEERSGIPHHLIDIVEPDEVFHAGEYRRRAGLVLDDLAARGKLPVLTVGTGLYLRALIEGLCEAPARSEDLRERLRRRASISGPGYLHRLIERLDPAAAKRIGQRDTPKMIRAIEVRLLSGQPISALHGGGQQGLQGYQPIKIGLMPSRQSLYARIDRRVQAMIDAGWVDEVQRLVSAGLPANAKPFQFIGYAELRDYLADAISLDEAISQVRQATRRYAKRQITWFRREAHVHWLEGFGYEPAIVQSALTVVREAIQESPPPDESAGPAGDLHQRGRL